MRIENGRANDVRIAYIGGGSCGWAWSLMADLALDGHMSGTVCLYDIDVGSAKKNSVIGKKFGSLPEAEGQWDYRVAENLEEALTGADFAVISILPGTFEEMRSDVHSPEKYGIYQSVGDTVGPGGLLRALRTLPIFAELALAVKEFCPNAWVINYTNPMTACLRALYTVFPEIKAFGCCHEVFGAQKLLAQMLEDVHGVKAERRDININVLGINHFTWIDEARYGGADLIPLYRDMAEARYDEGYAKGKDTNWMNDSFASANRVKFDLFRRYGYIAAAGDRHLAEFCPGKWYLGDPDTVRGWRFGLTTVDWRVDDFKRRQKRRERILNGEEELKPAASGEEGHLLMKALMGLGDTVSNVNLPNTGQISNLPVGAVVETNALFRAGVVRPIVSGAVPGNILSMLQPHVSNQETTVRAALECDEKLAFSVFANDPLVDIGLQDARELFEAMIRNTASYLPAAWTRE